MRARSRDHSHPRGFARVAKDVPDSKEEAPAGQVDGDAADAVEGEGGEEAAPKKKLPLRLIVIAGAAALVVLGGGGAAAFLFRMPHHAAPAHKLPPKPTVEKKDGKTDPNAPQVQDGPD